MILTTGGAGKVWPFTTNGNIKTGDGMALAYREGVALKDMEFVQYHPTGLPGTGILITEASRGEGGYLVNSEGERFLITRDYGVGTKAELGPRDMISRAIIQEIEAGRGIEVPGKIGQYVHLDLRHLGKAKLESRLPFVLELSRTYAGVDPVTQPIPIRPVLHYMMGGVDTNIDGATTIGGLYAAGETACVSLNGANRLGSNSLTECLVFGARAAPARRALREGRLGGQRGGAARADEDARARGSTALRGRKRGGEKLARRPRGDERGDGGRHRRLPRAGLDAEGGRRGGGAPAALRAGEPLGRQQGVQHRAHRGARARQPARRGRGGRARGREPEGEPRRARLPRLPEAQRRGVPAPLAGALRRRPGRASSTKPVTLGVWVPEERKY